jgi:cyclophilin family peptidyl-prolyl cis-trans isomerase
MKAIVLFFLSSSLIIAQYHENDYEIVKTTYQRSFDKEIITNYLHSENPDEVKAALLSVSHSEDTSFVYLIKHVKFNEHAELICFAIGQIGKCTESVKFLWDKVYSDDFGDKSKYIFESIGKTGTETDLEKVSEFYANFDGPVFPFEGISLAIRQFAFRGIKSDVSKQILIDEVINRLTSIERKSEALFTLARIGSAADINETLIGILKSDKVDPQNISLKQYALMNFRTQKYFPEDEVLFNTLLNESNTLLQIEIAKAICYKDFKTIAELDLYLDLINSENPNVSRSSANSLRNIHLDSDSLKKYLDSYLQEKIYADYPPHTLGEMLVSMVLLFDYNFVDKFRKLFHSSRIPINYYYDAIGYNNEDLIYLNKLIRSINDYISHPIAKPSIGISELSNLIKFQSSFPENEELQNILLKCLSSGSAPFVSIAADGVDSIFITNYSDSIKVIILNQIENGRNNPDFIEGIMSLVNLSEKINEEFYNEVISEVKISHLYSLRKFIADKTGEKLEFSKPLNNFGEIWENVFAYNTAKVETEKGIFTIEFLPGFAPASVGNFCKLADSDYFNGVDFHRVVPGFVIQGGDPSATGWGGPGYDIISEFSPLTYQIGMVGMASAGKDTEGSQWFVMQGNYPHLNGRYTIFAKVISGMDVVYKIDQNDKIIKVQLLP